MLYRTTVRWTLICTLRNLEIMCLKEEEEKKVVDIAQVMMIVMNRMNRMNRITCRKKWR